MRKGECAVWFEKQAKFKQDKAVVKLFDEKGNCDDSGMNTLQRKMKKEGLMEWIK